MKKKLKDSWYVLFFFLFLLFWYGVWQNWFYSVDFAVYQFSQLFLTEAMTLGMKLITFLGSPIWLGILVVLCFFKLKKNQSRFYLLFVMALDVTSNWILKNWIQRPRPSFPHLVTENSFSFPSGHAMGSMAFYGVLLVFLWTSDCSFQKKWIGTILLSAVVLLISFSRIYLGVHYFSDVVAGIFLSLFLLGLAKDIVKKVLRT